jgi:hypothetical protein
MFHLAEAIFPKQVICRLKPEMEKQLKEWMF